MQLNARITTFKNQYTSRGIFDDFDQSLILCTVLIFTKKNRVGVYDKTIFQDNYTRKTMKIQ